MPTYQGGPKKGVRLVTVSTYTWKWSLLPLPFGFANLDPEMVRKAGLLRPLSSTNLGFPDVSFVFSLTSTIITTSCAGNDICIFWASEVTTTANLLFTHVPTRAGPNRSIPLSISPFFSYRLSVRNLQSLFFNLLFKLLSRLAMVSSLPTLPNHTQKFENRGDQQESKKETGRKD